jgi:hypothetical protein
MTDRPVPMNFEVLDGGREALERAYMWAILFDHPDKQALARRLRPAANDALREVVQRDHGPQDEPPSPQG